MLAPKEFHGGHTLRRRPREPVLQGRPRTLLFLERRAPEDRAVHKKAHTIQYSDSLVPVLSD